MTIGSAVSKGKRSKATVFLLGWQKITIRCSKILHLSTSVCQSCRANYCISLNCFVCSFIIYRFIASLTTAFRLSCSFISQNIKGSLMKNRYGKLKSLFEQHKGKLYFFDFDGYDHKRLNLTLEQVLYNENKKMVCKVNKFVTWY